MQKVDFLIMGCAALVLLLGGIALLPSIPSEYVLESSYNSSCKELMNRQGCDPEKVRTIVAFESARAAYTLGTLCAHFGYEDTVTCANSCGCRVDKTTPATILLDTPVKYYSENPVTEGVIIIEEEYDEVYDQV